MKHAAVIDEIGGNKVAAALCAADQLAVANWKRRNSIPSRYWPIIVKMAQEKAERLAAITLDALKRND